MCFFPVFRGFHLKVLFRLIVENDFEGNVASSQVEENCHNAEAEEIFG
jgi:hypothetical protein